MPHMKFLSSCGSKVMTKDKACDTNSTIFRINVMVKVI